jgi:3'-phosphoadenosine 5'-phosphosulfate sulfotransferase (PAPS reductase)/FAD synthetase
MLHLTPAFPTLPTEQLRAAIERHGPGRTAFSFSGGKDSTACAFLLRELADQVTVYCVDTGDLMPDTQATIAAVRPMFPHFELIRTDVGSWIDANGLPSDLVPYHSHWIGRAIGQAAEPLVHRYDCCWHNIMWPILERVKQRGHTLLIRGTKAADMPRLPIGDGQTADGIEMAYPLQDWTDEQVFAFLREQPIAVSPVYAHGKGQLDCATCPAWWAERRGAYLKANHPELFTRYADRFSRVTAALAEPFDALVAEIDVVGGEF